MCYVLEMKQFEKHFKESEIKADCDIHVKEVSPEEDDEEKEKEIDLSDSDLNEEMYVTFHVLFFHLSFN